MSTSRARLLLSIVFAALAWLVGPGAVISTARAACAPTVATRHAAPIMHGVAMLTPADQRSQTAAPGDAIDLEVDDEDPSCGEATDFAPRLVVHQSPHTAHHAVHSGISRLTVSSGLARGPPA